MTVSPLKCVSIALCCAIALFAYAGSASASSWTVRQLPPKPLEGDSDQVALFGVSCPSESLCVAVGSLDTVAFSQEPTGGADRWHVGYPTYDEPKQSCLEEEVPAASCSYPRGALDGVSCATESLCIAVGYEGSVYVSTDPTGDASAWSVSDVNGGRNATHLTAVSCPSVSFCVAVSGGYGEAAGTVLTSSAPALGRWQATHLGGSPDLRGVSCATPSLCVAVAKGGRIFVSGNPGSGASAWREAASPTPRDLQAVSCVVELLCAVGDAGGNILISTNPTDGRAFTETNTAGAVQITGLTCATTRRCVAVDNNADVLTSTDPTGGLGAWTFENLVPFEATQRDTGQFVKNALWDASCPSPSLCVLVGADSRIFTATDPFAAPVYPHLAGHPRRRARRRPRTHLVFAEHFWKLSLTRRRHIRARFHFYSRGRPRGFECRRDHRRWRRCHSPLRYWVSRGRHVLRVRAVGRTGLRGPAAIKRFRIVAPRGHRQ